MRWREAVTFVGETHPSKLQGGWVGWGVDPSTQAPGSQVECREEVASSIQPPGAHAECREAVACVDKTQPCRTLGPRPIHPDTWHPGRMP